mmetsp:Transcript_21525/g.24529  ORF Transcript_21525/g.24529 Transcript_21525/m.24529 type:complete len:223 (-) Transcript_21525:166-834(-)|eukprot:CAMPEP_0194129726 /NCGR_PEP_ID=MMETSP0152-20130528/939_1 /TAXON_ID=1049557 /ORGANISM="Thalassiothrix antarctica, Strain L6-D1" /LENGTH=222 /DNA_ID=CAMNT_0038824049 /DNA_START=71 /DNA_END=739 /DNA_ORIENTATION=-
MKFCLVALLPLVSAFAPTQIGIRNNRIALNAEARPDTSELIQKALEASKEFGASSSEARLAWETVEEMDASKRTSNVSAGVNAESCEVEDEPSQECLDYGEKMELLAKLIAKAGPTVSRAKDLALDLKKIKLTGVDMPVGESNPAISEALKVAKDVTEEFGADSKEAKLAWEDLEEISSASEASAALGGTLDDECLTEMVEACEAMEEVTRVLNLGKGGPKD